jgi:hypothetical protein
MRVSSESAAAARRLLNDACTKLPPESLGDHFAKIYRGLDRPTRLSEMTRRSR